MCPERGDHLAAMCVTQPIQGNTMGRSKFVSQKAATNCSASRW